MGFLEMAVEAGRSAVSHRRGGFHDLAAFSLKEACAHPHAVVREVFQGGFPERGAENAAEMSQAHSACLGELRDAQVPFRIPVCNHPECRAEPFDAAAAEGRGGFRGISFSGIREPFDFACDPPQEAQGGFPPEGGMIFQFAAELFQNGFQKDMRVSVQNIAFQARSGAVGFSFVGCGFVSAAFFREKLRGLELDEIPFGADPAETLSLVEFGLSDDADVSGLKRHDFVLHNEDAASAAAEPDFQTVMQMEGFDLFRRRGVEKMIYREIRFARDGFVIALKTLKRSVLHDFSLFLQ